MSTAGTTITHGITLETAGCDLPLASTASGRIDGNGAARIYSTPAGTATVVNEGTILASKRYAVSIDGNISLDNAGLISGDAGMQLDGGTVVNSGTIAGNPAGYGICIQFDVGGSVTNAASGLISGGNYGSASSMTRPPPLSTVTTPPSRGSTAAPSSALPALR